MSSSLEQKAALLLELARLLNLTLEPFSIEEWRHNVLENVITEIERVATSIAKEWRTGKV